MLSLIRAASSRTALKDRRSAQRLLRTLHSAPLDHRPLRATAALNAARSVRSRHIHQSTRLFAAAAVPEPSSDATPKKTPDSDSNKESAGSTVDTPSSTRQPATGAASPLAKRRAKLQRAIGRATHRTSLATDPTAKVYVPSIPESFLATHYHPALSLSVDNKTTFASLPYHIHQSVQDEVLNTIASCLLTPAGPQAHIHRMPARHNNVLLSSPSEGSSQMLEAITMVAARKVGASVITIDVQDLMELTPDMFNSKSTGNPWPVDFLARGFNPFVSSPIPIEFLEDLDDSSDDEFQDDVDDDDDQDDNERASTPTAVFLDSRIFSKGRHGNGNGRHGHSSSALSLKEKFEKFWTALLLAEPKTLSASSTSAAAATTRTTAGSGDTTATTSAPKILFLRDIADIIHTPLGSTLIPSLTSAVLTLRKAGHNIMVVAGHSPSLLTTRQDGQHSGDGGFLDGQSLGDAYSDDTEVTKEMSLVTILQKLRSPTSADSGRSAMESNASSMLLTSLAYDTFPGPTQTFHHISIPPFVAPPTVSTTTAKMGTGSLTHPVDRETQQRYALENAQQLRQDKAERIKQVNSRNMLAVLQFRGGVLSESESPLQAFGSLRGIDTEVWGFGKVYRVISNALGTLYLSDLEARGGEGASTGKAAVLSESHFRGALETSNENARLRKVIATSDWTGNKKAPVAKPLVRAEDCNRYERKLLGSIVDPEKIKTTFKNTITPAETVNALQTMITLPLIRPQLFSQGLLQNEFLSGLLLFGPPGTGKTLLAKAVAKESGARMLEIKASDIFDMYVGEGEKNVSAVFSLARKLSPCVIFLDEVDSVFRARSLGGAGGGGSGGHSSQREILNQFMVEWDGLRSSGQNNGIVVMASTNRPFELDDAVLRRLPRRILVDLPSEQAREKILNVYLSQETLDEGIDVKELAKKTAFFSGSDLKNLCVSAALASVREVVEGEVKALQGGDAASADEFVPDASAMVAGDKDKDAKEKDRVLDLSPLLDQYKQEAFAKITAPAPSPLTTSATETTAATRVIHKRHFDKALAQITPSCSENMESLTELRKWDGLYGDGGKGRRKGIKSLGFEVESDTINKSKPL
ncbi:hypothetical protein EC957_007222 [Mortierella hygrophila]|uniref:AAA+ ATPase domain-containing protein n=1 Tax=Mortierella hygrophila TaxID=979708 RepID=A0A9P6JYP4_9FUNG|nr:hypothetical protein EC957_007222 [Mortierella hygrophila]